MNVEAKDIPPSKSLYNRALILKSFAPDLDISCESDFEAEDVRLLKQALVDFEAGKKDFFCGSGAAPLRFLAIRLSHLEGSYTLRGSERLFMRPQVDLLKVLDQLGCENIEIGKDFLKFRATAKWPAKIFLNPESSSQILSSLLLSAWNLEEEVEVVLTHEDVASWSYAQMTLHILTQTGWQGEVKKQDGVLHFILPKKQQIAVDQFVIEPDMSCVAALALLGALKDGARFWALPLESAQGDSVIFKLLKEMGHRVLRSSSDSLMGYENIRVEKAKSYQGIEVDLKTTPDLFPVLAAFCATAKTPSKLMSLGNLNSKESRRLDRMQELLKRVGVKCETFGDDLLIIPTEKLLSEKMAYDPDQDHRLAMAAAILNTSGAQLQISYPEVVEKSFPNFWSFV